MSNDEDFYIVTMDKWGNVNEIIEGPMTNLSDVKKAFDNLKDAGPKQAMVFNVLFEIIQKAVSSMPEDKKRPLLDIYVKYFNKKISFEDMQKELNNL